MAYTDEELERLEKEKNLFDSIATRDPSTYIVRRLLWELIGPESIYNLDPTGEILPSPLAQKGLVLEAGGPNLMQYLKEYPHTPEIHRIQILEVIIRAVKYLHDAKFIHGDLKPENIVLFFSENDHTSRWKLVDFDNSFDLSSHTPPKLSQVTRYTKVYCPPELLRYSYNPSSDHDTVISFSFDIWSLGTLALFLLADTIFWSLVYPMSHSFEECWASFVRANPTDIQELINLKLKTRCGAKLRELLGKCFQLNPQSRSTAGEILLTKRLFGSGETTVNENLLRASESVKQGVDGINQLFSRFEALGTPVTCNELESKIEDLHHSFVNLIERMQINSQ